MNVQQRVTRSENMARIRGTGTAPEMRLRRGLWRAGHRYRVKSKLPGRPDLVFSRERLAVFVDGCFWHGCPLHYSGPARRRSFWARKLADNVRRDREVDAALVKAGWRPLHIWQHDLTNTEDAIETVVRALGSSDLPVNQSPATPLELSPPWYTCFCGGRNVRVQAVSGPGSLRPRAQTRPAWVELVCFECGAVTKREPHFEK